MEPVLQKISGLPLGLEDSQLVFGGDLPVVQPDIRHTKDIKGLLAPNSELTGPEDAYYMYRDIGWDEDKRMFRRLNYRYDITVLRPGVIGHELLKTVGHNHPLIPGTNVTYPEVYEVVSGRAHYICQKVEGRKVIEFFVVDALPGQKVVIPPGYGHITINPLNEPLVMSNVTADGFKSIYTPLEELHGAAFYEFEDGKWVPNKDYDIAAKPVWAKANEVPSFGLTEAIPLYESIANNPELFDYLVNPQNYAETFAKALALDGSIL
jgi:glucose-6-phosphate isomerase